MSRTVVLTGALQTSKLEWSEEPFISLTHKVSKSSDTLLEPHIFTPSWEQLNTSKIQMRPVLPKLEIDPPSLRDVVDNGPADFFSTSEHLSQDLIQESAGSDVSAEDSRPSQDSGDVEDEALSSFHRHSFTIYEAIPSSQMTDVSVYTPGTPTYDSSDEMFAMTPSSSGGIIKSPSERRLSQAPRPKRLTSLCDIQNGSYLHAIHPQTITVNMVVGILSISPPSQITTRGSYGLSRQVELIELVVGDETKSGFSVSMWMPREMHVNWKDGAQEKPEGGRSNLRKNLKSLRRGDIVLLQNVALSAYHGKVHGQSLKGDVTKIDLLFRKKREDDDKLGCYSVQNLRMATGRDMQIMKVKRVRDWIVDSVGEYVVNSRRRDRGPDDHGPHHLLPDY